MAQNGSEDLKEGIVYIVENLNFRPDEHSFVEPWVEADADKPKEEEKKEVAAPVDPKKMTPAEKKKYEEELKRKAEEEANKPVKSEAELEKEAKARQAKEEAAKQRAIDDYFDFKTTFKYVQDLQSLGSVYVNDAPTATLTTSNSIAEVNHRQNVMGPKMTEEIRKLAKFFMKPFPLDTQMRHVKRPKDRDYFQTKTAAVIGGLCRTSAELLDKILMVNQLIAQNQKIYLVGEIGLAAVSALLDNTVCKVDHNTLNYQEFSRFFQMLFQKARQHGCELVLPLDFQTAHKLNRGTILGGGANAEERPRSGSAAEENSGSKAKSKSNTIVESAQPEQPKELSVEARIWQDNSSLHWSDVSIKAGKASIVDLEEQILNKLNGSGSRSSHGTSGASPAAPKTPPEDGTREDAASQRESIAGGEKVVCLDPESYLLQYGPKTLHMLQEACKTTFKLFWDGSVSLFQETACSSQNNKDFLTTLLDVRTNTEQDQEPPVTLFHGSETE